MREKRRACRSPERAENVLLPINFVNPNDRCLRQYRKARRAYRAEVEMARTAHRKAYRAAGHACRENCGDDRAACRLATRQAYRKCRPQAQRVHDVAADALEVAHTVCEKDPTNRACIGAMRTADFKYRFVAAEALNSCRAEHFKARAACLRAN